MQHGTVGISLLTVLALLVGASSAGAVAPSAALLFTASAIGVSASNVAQTTATDSVLESDGFDLPSSGRVSPLHFVHNAAPQEAFTTSANGTARALSGSSLDALLESTNTGVHVTFNGAASATATGNVIGTSDWHDSGTGTASMDIRFSVTGTVTYNLVESLQRSGPVDDFSRLQLRRLLPTSAVIVNVQGDDPRTFAGNLTDGTYQLIIQQTAVAVAPAVAGMQSASLTTHGTADLRIRVPSPCPTGAIIDTNDDHVVDATDGVTDGPDVVCGTAGNDRLIGLGGNDRLIGLGGDDTLIGGAGDDTLEGGAGNDHLFGGAGNDRLNGGSGDDEAFGGRGNDTISDPAGDGHIYGCAGADRIVVQGKLGPHEREAHGDFANTSNGELGRRFGIANPSLEIGCDTTSGAPGGDVMTLHDVFGFGEAGNDRIDVSGVSIVLGDAGNDRITATGGNPILSGGAGNDVLLGGKGHETIDGDAGRDTIRGGAGDDLIDGGAGNDAITGGAGRDHASGGAGNDAINGGPGRDVPARRWRERCDRGHRRRGRLRRWRVGRRLGALRRRRQGAAGRAADLSLGPHTGGRGLPMPRHPARRRRPDAQHPHRRTLDRTGRGGGRAGLL